MVPVTMRERFNWVSDTGTSVATYTNFRRFQTCGQNSAAAMTRLVLTVVTTASMAAFSATVRRPSVDGGTRAPRCAIWSSTQPKLSALRRRMRTLRQETPPLTSIMVRPYWSRRLESEVAFARLPGEKTWLGFRRVRKIDGKEIADTLPTLVDLLSLGPSDRLAASTTAGDARVRETQPRIAAHDQPAKPAARAAATQGTASAIRRQPRRHRPSSRPPDHRIAVHGTCGAVNRGLR